MTFPPIKRTGVFELAGGALEECETCEHIINEVETACEVACAKLLKEERLSRAKWARALVEKLSTTIVPESGVIEELLKEAEVDEK